MISSKNGPISLLGEGGEYKTKSIATYILTGTVFVGVENDVVQGHGAGDRGAANPSEAHEAADRRSEGNLTRTRTHTHTHKRPQPHKTFLSTIGIGEGDSFLANESSFYPLTAPIFRVPHSNKSMGSRREIQLG